MDTCEYISSLRKPTREHPLTILLSSCLLGNLCGADGTSYGQYPQVLKLKQFSNVKLITFCPEHYSFGTPREICDIHGGDGYDVLQGKAKVLTGSGADWTDGMIRAATRMLEFARHATIDLAIMMDISAACGSRVIYKGSRLSEHKRYQTGVGVCTAMLRENGYHVISQREFAWLELLYAKLDPDYMIDKTAKNHDQTEWYLSYFANG